MTSDITLDYDACKPYLYNTNINGDYLKFHAPSRIMVYGQSGTGKTTLVCKILSRHEQLFVFPVANIMYLNPMAQEGSTYYPRSTVNYLHNIFPNMLISTTVPELNDSEFDAWVKKHSLPNGELAHLALVIDDFQDSLHLLERQLKSLFVKISRHGNISIFITLQNPSVGTNGGPGGRAISCMRRNCNAVIVFDNASCPTLLGYIEREHDPLRKGRYTNTGKTLRRCLREAEQWLPSGHAYVVCNFNLHNKIRSVFPASSCIVGEIHEKVLAMLWWAHDYEEEEENEQQERLPPRTLENNNADSSLSDEDEEKNNKRERQTFPSETSTWSPSASEVSATSETDASQTSPISSASSFAA